MAREKIERQIIEMEKLNRECKTPGRRQCQLLEGKDPSKEDLEAKLSVLERLERTKRSGYWKRHCHDRGGNGDIILHSVEIDQDKQSQLYVIE